jgi:peptidyl-prolyl cis-trans isomerase C
MKKLCISVYFTVLMTALFLVFSTMAFSAEQSREDPYIATFEGGGIKLSEAKELIKKAEYRKGTRLSKGDKKSLVVQLVEKELLFKKAVSAGTDKQPEVLQDIHNATLGVVADAFLKDYISKQNIRVTDQDAEAYYQKNASKYNTPDLYQGIVFYINKKNKAGQAVNEKSLQVSEEIKAYITVINFQNFDGTLKVFGEKYPDLNFDKFIISGYYKGKNLAVAQPVLDTFIMLTPGQATITELPDFYAVIVSTDFTQSQPLQFKVIKNRLIAELEAQKYQQAYNELIESLIKEYKYSFNTELLDKTKEH